MASSEDKNEEDGGLPPMRVASVLRDPVSELRYEKLTHEDHKRVAARLVRDMSGMLAKKDGEPGIHMLFQAEHHGDWRAIAVVDNVDNLMFDIYYDREDECYIATAYKSLLLLTYQLEELPHGQI